MLCTPEIFEALIRLGGMYTFPTGQESANNRITHIPNEILKLPLKKFNFKDNPPIDPPKAEVKVGLDGLKAWWGRE